MLERQLREIRQHLASLGGSSPALTVLKPTKSDKNTPTLNRMKTDIDNIKASLGQEKLRRTRLEEMTERLEHALEKQGSGVDVNGLHNTTQWLKDRITALEEKYLAITNSSEDNAGPILENREMANMIGVQFNGEPLNSRSPEVFHALYTEGYRENGVYRVLLPGKKLGLVWCDFEYSDDSSGRGWMVVQRRINGELDFNKTWEEYRQGFGDLSSEFWLGNEYIWPLLNSSKFSIYVKIFLGGNQTSNFSLSDNANNYLCSEAEDYQLYYDDVTYRPFASSQYPLSGSTFMTWDRKQLRPGCPPLDGGWWYSERECHRRKTNPNSSYKLNRSPKDGELYRGYFNVFTLDNFWQERVLIQLVRGSEVLIYV
ncbi:ficolin-3-like [Liolophura sinensis]|uniref:ficolin-3-like n=1 Tax=Liolophura sinensis TaxID=3198878 RepID=UPI003158667F